jgi:CubicO group peptidase (beta-lactamase class C family)
MQQPAHGVMVGSPPPLAARVTLANWRYAPFNRWAYLHMRELIPTANISRGQGPVWDLPRAAFDFDEVSYQVPGTDAQTVGEFLDHSWTDCLIVLNRGRIVAEEYRNAMRADSRHLSMSVGKSITSLVIGVLVGRGLIETQSLITDYIPELAGSACGGATVQHALDMEVANGWHEDYDTDTTDDPRLEVACGWLPAQLGMASTLFDFMLESRSDRRHGERIQYSCLNTDVLGLVAERVTGSRFADLVSETLWAPAGMEFDADLTVDPGGTAVADGGYCIAARDFARLGQLALNRGMAADRRVVPAAWITEYQTPNHRPFHPASYGADWPGASYHNQWWQMDGRLFAVGVNGQLIAVDYDTETVVVILSSAPEPNDASQGVTRRRVVDAISAALR